MTIFFLDSLQYFGQTVGHVVANQWLVGPVILVSLVAIVAVGYVLAWGERD